MLSTAALSKEDTAELYEQGILYLDGSDNFYDDPQPQKALSADLSAGDVVFFDHTQLHGFATQSEVRQSYAYYY